MNSYTATVTVSSKGNDSDIQVGIEWEPALTDDKIEEMGFTPASYAFTRDVLLQAIEYSLTDSEEVDVTDVEGSAVLH